MLHYVQHDKNDLDNTDIKLSVLTSSNLLLLSIVKASFFSALAYSQFSLSRFFVKE
jgi:hypothetical protein